MNFPTVKAALKRGWKWWCDMTVKERLERAGKIEREIENLNQTIQEVKDRLYSVTGRMDGDRVQSGKTNMHEINLCRYMQLKQMLERRINTLISAQMSIISIINMLDDALYRNLLMQKYINGKTIPQIADQVCYTERWTAKLLSRALCELENILSQNELAG